MDNSPEESTDETVNPTKDVNIQGDEFNQLFENRESLNLLTHDEDEDSDHDDEHEEDGEEENERVRDERDEYVKDEKEEDEYEGKEEEEEEEEEEERDEIEEKEEEEEEEEEDTEAEGQHLDEEKLSMEYPFQMAKEIKVKSDNDLSKIPSEVYLDRNAMLQMLRDLTIEKPNLTLRNKYLEYKVFKHLQSVQISGSPPIDDGSTLDDEVERERYMNFLGNHKKESELLRGRENEIKLTLENLEEKLEERCSEDAEIFGVLTTLETAVAIDLLFATTGRRLGQKYVEEMIRRQTSRRQKVAHERYTFIRQWYTFEKIDARIRRLETLGPGMRIGDYEAEYSVKLTAKTKIDERNKDLQKARNRVCGIMAAITHGKVKLDFLRDENEREKNRLDEIVESVHEQREELSTMRSRLSITRNRYLKKRETAGLMLAMPTLREMERIMEQRDLWKQEVDHLRSLIPKPQSHITKKNARLRTESSQL